MTAYAKGSRVEREAQELLASLGLPTFRVAGSHGVDLVVPKLAIEVKWRTVLPLTLMQTFARPLLSKRGFMAISLPHLLNPPLLNPAPVDRIPLEHLTPPSGLLLVRSPRKPWIFIGQRLIISQLQEEVSCAKLPQTGT